MPANPSWRLCRTNRDSAPQGVQDSSGLLPSTHRAADLRVGSARWDGLAMRTALTPLTMILTGLLVTGCLPPADRQMILEIFPSLSDAISRGPSADASSVLNPGSRTLRLRAAGNETVHFVITVEPRDGVVESPRFQFTPLRSLRGAMEPEIFTVYRVHRVRADRYPGWHIRSVPPDRRNELPFDVLVPVEAPTGGLPQALLPGEVYQFWVDAAVPRGAAPGEYACAMELYSGSQPVDEIDIRVTVWPFDLPPEDEIPLIAALDHRALFRAHPAADGTPHRFAPDDWRDSPTRDQLDEILNRTLRMLGDHRITPILPELSPIPKIGSSGRLQVDWSHFDSVVTPCLDGSAFGHGVGLGVWPLPVSRFVDRFLRNRGRVAAGSSDLFGQYLQACARHFSERGWLQRSYAAVESQFLDSAAMQTTKDFAAVVDQVGFDLPLLSRLFPQKLAPFGWVDLETADLTGEVDIWAPPAQFYDPDAMEKERSAGRRTWLSIDRPPYSGTYSIYARAADTRVLAWQALNLKAGALMAGPVNPWPQRAAPLTPQACVDADPSVLIYPGSVFGLSAPIASVRLKQLRRSMQDAAYIALLRRNRLDYVSEPLLEALAPYAGTDAYRTHFADGRSPGWPQDERMFDTAREIMGNVLSDRITAGEEQVRSEVFAQNLQWRRFMLAGRRLEMTVEGVRVRRADPGSPKPIRVDCSVTLFNHKRSPVSGTIRLRALPANWEVQEETRSVSPIPPGRSRRFTLTAYAETVPTNGAGIMYLPVEFTDHTGAVHLTDARIPSVVAPPFGQNIRIDGNLSDWPRGATNVASDFVLITGEPSDPAESYASRPRHPTSALLLRDANNLYLAIQCRSGGGMDRDLRRKAVRFDDLVPMDEELIEVLIDPLNAGTRSPSDLYRVVVKRSGIDIAKRGLKVDPPYGDWTPWAVDLDVSTRVGEGGWTVEIRIPIDALGEGAAEAGWWGFNITRFDLEHQEFSTWSGARGNAYDPLGLGNLRILEAEDDGGAEE